MPREMGDRESRECKGGDGRKNETNQGLQRAHVKSPYFARFFTCNEEREKVKRLLFAHHPDGHVFDYPLFLSLWHFLSEGVLGPSQFISWWPSARPW